jgi:AcrR family transcriptional regulator
VVYTVGVPYGSSLRDRTSTAILDAAAAAFSRHGAHASMDEVADAAGVGRATLYRHFPSREVLLEALAAYALDETCAHFGAAEVAVVPVREGVARAARALVAAWNKYAVLASEIEDIKRAGVEERIGVPLRALFRRGMADGTLRAEWTEDELAHVFGGLLHAAGQMTAAGTMGTERAAALVTTVFLEGTGVR